MKTQSPFALLLVFGLAMCPAVAGAASLAHYTFDDPNDLFADSSGNDNHGSALAGNPMQDSVNKIAGAGSLDLDGNDAGEINAVAGSVSTLTHTLSAWVRTTATNRPTFLAANTSSGGNSNMLFITGGASATAQAFSDPPGSFVAVAGAPVVNDDAWHHIAWVKDGTDGELYVDGMLRAMTNQANYVRTPTDLWSLGQEFDGGSLGDFWTGQIDDVQIYDEALTSDQIDFLFNNPGQVFAIPEPTSLAPWSLIGLCLAGFGFIRVRRRKK